LSVTTEVAILAVLSVVFMFLAKYSLDYMERLGKTTGRLPLRWQ